ncbi:uncharacterized protein LOC131249406 [Magnolia sinica]|uniref:uncharacterized protein LOC131249406 n=1 Tax=Magnolia sinica TaxID=86752 RepID=UPI0026583B47|nr:uncharacterized protein LOC131249406 [Magnolia sinica]
MEGGKRDARRRRLSDSGADRMAFITGKIQALPENEKPIPIPAPKLTRRDAISVGRHREDEADDSEAVTNSLVNGSEVHPLLVPKSISLPTTVQKSFSLPLEALKSPSLSLVGPNSSNSTSHTESHVQPLPAFRRIFTARQITSSISASENIRLLCAAVIALWAVIWYRSYDSGATASRPLYLLSLTDVTVVIGLLLAGHGGAHARAEVGPRNSGQDADDWAEKAGRALELGLVLQKAVTAFLMDFSVYAVLLISGFSLMQYW